MEFFSPDLSLKTEAVLAVGLRLVEARQVEPLLVLLLESLQRIVPLAGQGHGDKSGKVSSLRRRDPLVFVALLEKGSNGQKRTGWAWTKER